ncbi:hypothetical protein [Enhygromyxa salina]|nr:hypothetical protein [Enhygromyxa salina]
MDGGGVFGSVAAAFALPVAAAIYILLFWGKRSSGECSWREDDQIGLKVIVGTLIMVGTALFAGGLQGLLHLLLTFKEFVPRIKAALPDLLVGAVVVGGAIMFAVPKTNHEQQPKALRLTAGAIALVGAVATVVGLDSLLKTVFQWPSWHAVAGSFTTLLTSAVVFAGAGFLYAKMVGVEVPDIPMPANAPAQVQAHAQPAQAQPQQGYQQPAQVQPQQGYQQPQQGGYQQPQQPQQPQGGGYPPSGQSGGSAPPRPGGGAAPPPGGGGYPPGGGPYGQ